MSESFSIDDLTAQEAELQFASFTNDDALELGSRLVEMARAINAPVAIHIERSGHTLFHAALPGATPDNDGWIARKVNVVRRFEHSSLYIGQMLASAGTTLADTYALSELDYAPHGGAFPIIVRDVGVVGVVVVSGLPQLDDHQLVVDAIRAHLARD